VTTYKQADAELNQALTVIRYRKWDAARWLYNIREEQLYLEIGLQTFKAYVKTKEDLSERTANRWANLYGILINSGIHKADAMKFTSWEKLWICRWILTPSNIDAWVIKAKQLTKASLRAEVEVELAKALTGKEQPKPPKIVEVRLTVAERDQQMIVLGARQGQLVFNVRRAGAALARIVQSWLESRSYPTRNLQIQVESSE